MTDMRAIQADITTLDVDAVVNAANRALRPGGGVDGAIHRAGGPDIEREAQEHYRSRGPLAAGEAVATTAGQLPAQVVIHAVGPVWGEQTEYEAVQSLAACYRSSLDIADGEGCSSIAFPNISTGVYGFPKRLAAETAVSATGTWVEANPGRMEEILFACFNQGNLELYRELLG